MLDAGPDKDLKIKSISDLMRWVERVMQPKRLERVWTARFMDIANGASWFGGSGVARLGGTPFGAGDHYFSAGLMQDGAARRSNGNVIGWPILIADDIGTKVPRSLWEGLFALGCPRPSMRIQTSVDPATGAVNETWIWCLSGDPYGLGRVEEMLRLRAYVYARKLSDRVLDEARYIRLPVGWNSKPDYRASGSPVTGSPEVCLLGDRLDVDGYVDVDELGRALSGGNEDWLTCELDTDVAQFMTGAQIGAALSTGGLTRCADLSNPEPILALASEIGMKPVQRASGVVEALCPNIAQHTVRADTGFAFLGNGIMACQHASCAHLSTPQFRAMMMDQFDEQQPAGSRQDATGFLAGAAFAGSPLTGEVLPPVGAGGSDAATAPGTFPTDPAMQAQIDAMVAASIASGTPAPVADFTAEVFSIGAPGVTPMVPPREWLMGRHAIRGYLSVTVAAGGVGKSALVMSEFLSAAMGRAIIHAKPIAALRVVIWNGEDPKDELRRRLLGACAHFGATDAQIGGRLHLASGREAPIKIVTVGAGAGGGTVEIARPVVEKLVEWLVGNKIDYLCVDPFVSTHDASENDNAAINTVAEAWREVADRARCGIELVHHANKAGTALEGSGGVSAGVSRGASALVDAARSVRVLQRMTEEEGQRFGLVPGVDDYRNFFRIQNAKANLAPAEDAVWCRTVGVPLHNGRGLYPNGDVVGVAVPWVPPVMGSRGAVSHGVIRQVQADINSGTHGDYMLSAGNEQWAGFAVADALQIDIGQPGDRRDDRTSAQNAARIGVSQTLRWLIDEGYLEVVSVRTRKRYSDGVVVGKAPEAGDFAGPNMDPSGADILPDEGEDGEF